MLCLLVKKHLKRRKITEKRRPFKNNTALFKQYDTAFGEITVYTLYSHKGMEKAEKKLRRAVPFPLYTCHSQKDSEYRKKAVIKSAINLLKKSRGKTVYFALSKPDIKELIALCSLSDRLYIPFSLSQEEEDEIYRLCGALPIYANSPVACDIHLDENYPFKVSLPENLRCICPEEFSHELFASLLYRENGRFLL